MKKIPEKYAAIVLFVFSQLIAFLLCLGGASLGLTKVYLKTLPLPLVITGTVVLALIAVFTAVLLTILVTEKPTVNKS